jgi:hypothetical protein
LTGCKRRCLFFNKPLKIVPLEIGLPDTDLYGHDPKPRQDFSAETTTAAFRGLMQSCFQVARITRPGQPDPTLQQHRVRNDGLPYAGVAARVHDMEQVEILKPEIVRRRRWFISCWSQKLRRSAVIRVLDDPFAAAQFGDAVLVTQPRQNDADFSSAKNCRRATLADLLDDLLRRFLHPPGFLPTALLQWLRCTRKPSAICPLCLIGVHAGEFQFGLPFGRACNVLTARLIRNHTRRPSLSPRSSFLA